MADVTSGCTFSVGKGVGGKVLKIETAATVDDGDTIAITLADYGWVKPVAVFGFQHSTTDSVLVAEAPTTAVSAGVLTLTVGGSTDNKKRSFVVIGA